MTFGGCPVEHKACPRNNKLMHWACFESCCILTRDSNLPGFSYVAETLWTTGVILYRFEKFLYCGEGVGLDRKEMGNGCFATTLKKHRLRRL